MTRVLSTGWSYSWRSPVFTLAEAQAAVTLVYRTDPRSISNVCDVSWKGSSRPTIAFYTGAPYVPGYSTDRYWAVVQNWQRIVLNTSPRMVSRWYEVFPTPQQRIEALRGLWGHETSHILLRTMYTGYGFPPTAEYVAKLVRKFGKPHPKRGEGPGLGSVLDDDLELDAKPSLWQRIKGLFGARENLVVVEDRDDMTAEAFRRRIGMN